MTKPVQEEYEQTGLTWAVREERNDQVKSQMQIQIQFISKKV